MTERVVDLGTAPPCQSFLTADQLAGPESWYPLVVYVCADCLLVQLPAHVAAADIFTEYAYFSSYSDSWLEHARVFAETMIADLALGPDSLVVEVASNDGYLLRWFQGAGVGVLGVEPAANVAAAAGRLGIECISEFFGLELGQRLASEGRQADLICANNVLAHVPDINDFVAGFVPLLAPTGTLTFEFPHLVTLLRENQFDTIYHEHYSYLSLLTASRILGAAGITVFDVEEIPTHGGSLRLFCRHDADRTRPVTSRVDELARREAELGFDGLDVYRDFAARVLRIRHDLLAFLLRAAEAGERVMAYGAAGKGMTLLNYCGIREDLVAGVADRNSYKQGRFCPGSRIEVVPPEAIDEVRPDWVLILPWNLAEEITGQLGHVRSWGGRFVTAIPEVRELPEVRE